MTKRRLSEAFLPILTLAFQLGCGSANRPTISASIFRSVDFTFAPQYIAEISVRNVSSTDKKFKYISIVIYDPSGDALQVICSSRSSDYFSLTPGGVLQLGFDTEGYTSGLTRNNASLRLGVGVGDVISDELTVAEGALPQLKDLPEDGLVVSGEAKPTLVVLSNWRSIDLRSQGRLPRPESSRVREYSRPSAYKLTFTYLKKT